MKARPSIACIVSLLVASRAQEPTPASPQPPAAATARAPAIVLLLRRAAPKLDAERVRRQWARRVGEEVHDQPRAQGCWLQTRGDGIAGGRDGAQWTIALSRAPVDLPDTALPGLHDEGRAKLRTHKSQLVIATEPATDPEAVTRAYRLLGSVAASVWPGDVLGIGAAHHGTFDLVESDTFKELTGPDPLVALRPQVPISLVVFLSRERTLDEAALVTALAAELKVAFGVTEGGEGQNFVFATKEHALVQLGDRLIHLNVWPDEPPTADALEAIDDLRLRTALRDRKAAMQVVVPGDLADEAERRRIAARIIAALWGDDCLALSWYCDRRLVPAGADTTARLRHDDPVRATLDANVVPVVVARDESAMDKAMAQARATWAEAEAHLKRGGTVYAKFPFRTRKGENEHIWISVESVADGVVRGAIGNEPLDVADLELGSKVECKLAQLSDWLFERDGKRVGGYTIAVLEEQARRGK